MLVPLIAFRADSCRTCPLSAADDRRTATNSHDGTKQTLLRAAQTMTDRPIAGQLKALADDNQRRAEKASHVDAATAHPCGRNAYDVGMPGARSVTSFLFLRYRLQSFQSWG